MNLKAFYKTIICLAVLLIILSGCIDTPEEENLNSVESSGSESLSSGTSSASPDTGLHEETLRVGAFNIQVFGAKKASNPEVMNTLAEIIRTYDIVAIQEIRNRSQVALPELIEAVNSEGASYSDVVSKRLGRTSS